jgi:hypothetical protein
MSDPESDPQTAPNLPTPITPANRLLTAAEFHRLADVPPEIEWFANITNRHTRRAYENAIRDFMHFTGIRLARRSRKTRTRPRHAPASPRGAVVAVRISVRAERRRP